MATAESNKTSKPAAQQSIVEASTKQNYNNNDEITAQLGAAKAAIRSDPTEPRGYLRAGRLLVTIGRKDNAIALYRRGLQNVGKERVGYAKIREKLDALIEPIFCDPMKMLPAELLLWIFGYITFLQLNRCTGVSKRWKSELCSMRSLWANLDLSLAKRTVPKKAISRCINSSRGTVVRALLRRVQDPGEAVELLTRQCPRLHTLEIYEHRAGIRIPLAMLSQAINLRTLELYGIDVCMQELHQILKSCPQLIELSAGGLCPGKLVQDLAATTPYTRLQKMRLESRHIMFGSRDLMDLLARLPSLKVLDFTVDDGLNVNLLIEIDGRLPCWHCLEELFLDGPQLILSDLPPELRMLRTGSQLILQWPDTGRDALTSVPRVVKLRELALRGADFAQCKQMFADEVELETLTIIDMHLEAGDWYATNLVKVTNKLKSLCISLSTRMDDIFIPFLIRHTPLLELLRIEQGDLTGYGVKLVVQHMKNLKHLVMFNCRTVSMDAVRYANQAGLQVSHYGTADGPERVQLLMPPKRQT